MLSLFLTFSLTIATSNDAALESIKEGSQLHGFTAKALYVDDANRAFGAQFLHDATGFTFEYLRIESAPQGFLWVNTLPTSDKGEPHTQEHLLLGKGDRGRRLGSFESMELAESSAFTDQWRTCYHFHTVAGHDAFWPVMQSQLDALLNPDYTDEEIRREVRNFGVDKSDDGVLHLEEKGTVYNEMVRSYESPETVEWRAALRFAYGLHHPLSYESGGQPDAIRTMTATDIRAFHDAAYHLKNMGMVGAFPSSMSLGDVLDHTSAVLTGLADRRGVAMGERDMPQPEPAPLGAIKVVPFPYSDNTAPAPMMFGWASAKNVDDDAERILLELFLDAFAGDESTTLYKKVIDGKTRAIDIGASGVWSMVSQELAHPVWIGLTGVLPAKQTAASVAEVRALITAELARIAALPDGDPELVAFNDRVKSRIIAERRGLNKFLDSPPGFGFRGTGSSWLEHLTQLSKTKGFKKSLTLKPQLAAVEQSLSMSTNPWRTRIKAWGLLDAPYGIAAKPSPALRAHLDQARTERIAIELARLQKHYGTADSSSTLVQYQKDYDAQTAAIESAAKSSALPPLVDSAPMTFDDELKYTSAAVDGVPALRATFDSMVSARVSLAFNLDTVQEDDLFLLGTLPTLLTDVGVIVDGKPVAADEMHELLRKEVLGLSAATGGNPRTGRYELSVAGAGNDFDETKAALTWMERVLLSPDWRKENLPRMRDVVDQSLTNVRQTMQGAEEGWVEGPRDAWWKQTSPMYLHTESFLTQAHDLFRLKWLLAADDVKRASEAADVLEKLAATRGTREQLLDVASKLSGSPLLILAGKDLAATVPELPDGSLAADWNYLCKEMARDLRVGAPATLARLERVRKSIVTLQNARFVEVGSGAHQAAVSTSLDQLLLKLDKARAPKAKRSTRRFIEGRLRDHEATANKAGDAVFVGLVDPATSSGVFLNAAPAPDYHATSDELMLDYLAALTYSGHGEHSMFMKTWAAGLAYSNGLHPQPWSGRVEYYAERCPLLPQTLRFVIDQLKHSTVDTNIARYAVAGAFDSRVAAGYEERASAMAANLVDGDSPDVIRAFRSHIMSLAKRPDLADKLSSRMLKVYGAVLPGLGQPVKDGVYFVIGPESQLKAYEDYLHGTSKGAVLHRLYPRDFWLTR